MKRKLLSYFLGWVFAVLLGMWWLWWNSVNAACWDECDWISLNTCFPVIWDCIHLKGKDGWQWMNPTTVFPYMMWAIMRIIMSVVLVVCFIFVIVAWIKWASNDPKSARDLLKKVAITVLLLWLSGVILKVINPLFFW